MPDEFPNSIADRTIGQYLAALGAPEPTPGGGSASGIVGALGSALGQMALSLTDIDASDHADELRRAQESLASLRERYLELARADETAYQGYRNATDLPKGTDEEESVRRIAMQDALKKAAGVPMAMCEASVELAETLLPVRAHGNRHLRSDAMVAATFARACFYASRTLVDANLGMIKDADWVEDITTRLDQHASRLDAATVT
jgi:methenyltetrahydrofolate cyclohydrolase